METPNPNDEQPEHPLRLAHTKNLVGVLWMVLLLLGGAAVIAGVLIFVV